MRGRRLNLFSLGLTHLDADVNAPNCWCITPLMRAAGSGSVPLVKAVLSRRPDVGARDKDGATALHYAHVYAERVRPRLALLRLLLHHGADVDAAFPDGTQTLLMWAVVEHRPALAHLLLRKGVDVEAGFGNGTPLVWAMAQGQPTIALDLIAAGADVNAAFDDGETALHFAANGEAAVARALLARGARVDARTSYGVTPLMNAVAAGEVEIMRLLIALGADVSARDEEAKAVLQWREWAPEGRRAAVMELLRAAGARE